MCGIAGIAFTAEPNPMNLLTQMAHALRHRGPDDMGSYVDEGIGLTMRRLSIIDLAGGHQPKSAAGGDLVVVFNGEIYNHRELRTELERIGHRFETHSDTEVVARSLEQWGNAAFGRLAGMFAVAAWYRASRRLVLARDRFGEKPLFVWRHGRGMAFASELKALAPIGAWPAIDLTAVDEYLHLGYVPCPRTIWNGIEKVPPGHVMTITEHGELLERYWELRPQPDDLQSPEEGLEERLQAAVDAMLVADVEVGILLSGGIDSSLITLAASRTTPAIKTFTIAFEDPARSEARYARAVAERCGTEHFEAVVTPSDAERLLPELTSTYDEPFADASAVPTMMVARHAADHVKVVLGGDGGDELFSGYARYGEVGRLQRLGTLLPPRVVTAARRLALRDDPVRSRIGNLSALIWPRASDTYRNRSALLTESMVSELRGASSSLGDLRARFSSVYDKWGERGPERADLAFYLVDDLLVKVDRATMRSSLEARLPYLDHNLVSWAMSLQPSSLGSPGQKELPRRLLERHLGPELARRPKQGFSVPLADWLAGPLQPALRAALAPAELARHRLFDEKVVTLLLRRLESGRKGMAGPLWSLLCFQWWYDRWY